MQEVHHRNVDAREVEKWPRANPLQNMRLLQAFSEHYRNLSSEYSEKGETDKAIEALDVAEKAMSQAIEYSHLALVEEVFQLVEVVLAATHHHHEGEHHHG